MQESGHLIQAENQIRPGKQIRQEIDGQNEHDGEGYIFAFPIKHDSHPNRYHHRQQYPEKGEKHANHSKQAMFGQNNAALQRGGHKYRIVPDQQVRRQTELQSGEQIENLQKNPYRKCTNI